MRKLGACTLLIGALFLSGCRFNIWPFSGEIEGNGKVESEIRNVRADFTRVIATSGFTVIVQQADAYAVRVEADKNILKYISTEVSGGEIEITTTRRIGSASSKTVYVYLPEVRGLFARSDATLKSKGVIKGQHLELQARSDAVMEVEVQVQMLSCQVRSDAVLEISGITQLLEAQARSDGYLDASQLMASTVEVEARSDGNARVHALDRLEITENSGGEVSHSGNPQKVITN